ncbi:hypothetical protein [Mucilaginibacter terrae]|uniref:Acyl carrier protein phosphodiesterase n=1 Tax=Mucilaginibacter terrae TaxID=1955052 RepID=A0ABU3GZI0_9SPHI|nr:hypothetical protein [Mucilaginibacter terrae]MDT3405177.1 acyl carrier protein phosphodiesterase [Mucilaginibacter terrae]
MNFLSHFYFDRHTTNCYHVLGTVLPDLLKNADKTIILHPEKHFYPDGPTHHIYNGWMKHLAVDRHFHNSGFFTTHSHQLKLHLRPAITGSPVKPFFLGHIALELILDNLLLTTQQITADDFYNHLDHCDDEVIEDFLNISGMKNPEVFTRFLHKFKNDRYLHTYAQTEKVAYALKRICMRVWNNPFTPEQEAAMNEVIISYRETLMPGFLLVFEEIGLLVN